MFKSITQLHLFLHRFLERVFETASSFTGPTPMRFNKVCKSQDAINILAQSALYPSPDSDTV